MKSKVKVDDLIGTQIDYAMTLAMGLDPRKVMVGANIHGDSVVFFWGYPDDKVYQPTKDWMHTGQLIENYNLLIESNNDGFYCFIDSQCERIILRSKSGNCASTGKTRLEAACKSVIKHTLGDEVYICDPVYSILGFGGDDE